MNRTTDRIFLGDINGATNLYQLRKNKITHILTMAAGIRPLYKKEFKYKIVNVMDIPSQNIISHFDRAIEFINKAVTGGGRVLVHCFAGVSRSASTVIAYFMATRKMTFAEAFNYVKKKRPIIFPNFGFQKQLVEYEALLEERSKKKEVKFKDEQTEEKKRTIEFDPKDSSSFTPFLKSNKMGLLGVQKPHKKYARSPGKPAQVKPKQFHYP